MRDESAPHESLNFRTHRAIRRQSRHANSNSCKTDLVREVYYMLGMVLQAAGLHEEAARLWSEPSIWTRITKRHSWRCRFLARRRGDVRSRIALSSDLSAPMIGEYGHDSNRKTVAIGR